MIVILLGWLALATFLPSLPSQALEIYPQLIKCAWGELCCAGKMTFFGFHFQIKLFQLFEHQFNAVQAFRGILAANIQMSPS